MRAFLIAIAALFGVLTSAAHAQTPTGWTCPDPSNERTATYLDDRRAIVIDAIADARDACEADADGVNDTQPAASEPAAAETEAAAGEDEASEEEDQIDPADTAYFARRAYTPAGAELPDRLVPATLVAMAELARQARARADASCRSGDSYVCTLNARIATRAELSLASARGLENAYSENPGRAAFPVGTIDVDEVQVNVEPMSDLTLPGGGVFDVLIGQTQAEGYNGPRLDPISTCAYIFTGAAYAENCGVSDAQARNRSWNIPCDAACAQRAVDVAEALRPAMALDALYSFVGSQTLMAAEAERDAENAANWLAYFFGGGDSRVQWPWELWINGARYEPEDHRIMQRRRLEDDSVQEYWGGRWAPPTDAFIVLHPGVGATFYDADDSEMKFTALAELIGYSRWSYREGKRHNEWGGSVIAAYHPGDDGDDWGYGVMVRTPYRGLNVAWVRRDGPGGEEEDGLMFSMKVGDLFSGGGVEGLCNTFGVQVPGLCE